MTQPTGSGLEDALRAAPDLVSQPALAQAAAQSAQPATSAQVLSHAQFLTAIESARQNVEQAPNNHGFLADLESAVGHVLGPVAPLLNMPLAEVQKNYRFVHYTFAHHGLLAGTALALPIVGAGVAGSLLGPGGAAAAADLTSTIERQAIGRTFDQKDFELSGRSDTGISWGRDIAHGLSNIPGLESLANTNSGWGKVISGAADGGVDLALDPIIVGGRLNFARKAGTLGRVGDTRLATALGLRAGDFAPFIKKGGAVQQFLATHAPGIKISEPDQIVNAVNAYSPVRRAVQDIADTVWRHGTGELAAANATGELIARYSDLSPLAADFALARGKTAEQTFDNIVNVFREASMNVEMARRLTGATLPSRSLLRASVAQVTEAARTAGGTRTVSGLGTGATGKMNSAQRALRTFTGYMPYAPDPETAKLSSKVFDPTDPASLPGVLRATKFGMGEILGRTLTGQFALAVRQGDMALAKKIWEQNQNETLKTLGLPDNPDVAQAIWGQSAAAVHGGDVGNYGFGRRLGVDVSTTKVYDQQGNLTGSFRAALTPDQRGMFAFPDYREARKAMRQLSEEHNYWINRGMSKVGGFDDLVAHYWTNKFFRPLVLLSTGFGIRVALAEAIPAAMRYGAMNMLKGSVAAQAAKMNVQLQPGEDEHVLAAASRALGSGAPAKGIKGYLSEGASRLINSPADRDLALQIVMENDGQLLHGVADSAHELYEFGDAQSKASYLQNALAKTQSLKRGSYDNYLLTRPARLEDYLKRGSRKMMPSDTYDIMSPGSKEFHDEWLTQLRKKTTQVDYQKMAADAKQLIGSGLNVDSDALYQEMVKREADRIRTDPSYQFARDTVAAYKSGESAESFAYRKVDDILNLLHSEDGTFHPDLATKMAKSIKPEMADIRNKYGPKGIIAPRMVPYIGPKAAERAVSYGYRKIVNPVINFLSREPMWFNAVKEEKRALMPLVESGKISDRTALQWAQRRAAHAILPQIHNTMFRSQFSNLAQNVLPFYFAQEQAIKRYGKLGTQNPAALRGFELIEHGLNDPGFVQTDSNGNRYLAFPASSGIGKLFLGAMQATGHPIVEGLPMSFNGNLASLNTILPTGEEPSVGPAAAFSLNMLAKKFPEMAPFVSNVAGQSAHEDLISALVPNNALRSIVNAYIGPDLSSQYANAYLTTMAEAQFHGKAPGPKASLMEQTDFNNKIKDTVRSKFWMKALLATFSPLSPNPTQGDVDKRFNETLSTEFYQLMQPKDKGGAGLDFNSAVQTLVKEYGEGALAYTVFKTESPTGASIPRTDAAWEFIQSHSDLLKNKDFGNAAAYLIPDSSNDPYSQLAYTELLASGLVRRKTPEEFKQSIYQMQGNAAYQREKAIHEQNLVQAGSAGWAQDQENARWKDVKNQLMLANPVWADWFTSNDKQNQAQQTLSGLVNLFSAGKAPAGQQTNAVGALLRDWAQHQANIATLQGTGSIMSRRRAQEHDAWSAYLTRLAITNPNLSNIISSVFEPLADLNSPLPSTSPTLALSA